MSEKIELAAEPRADLGKGASRRLRRTSNLVPGILYGGDSEPLPITLKQNELVKAMEQEAFASQIVHLTINGESERTVVRDVQRHPAQERVLHIDFLRVRAGQLLQIDVPIHFLNEDDCVGVRLGGGIITHTLTEVEISALPRNLPEFLSVDMKEVELNQIVHLSDIPLPEGVTIVPLTVDEHDLTVASVQPPRVQTDEDEEADADELATDDAADEGTDADDDDNDD